VEWLRASRGTFGVQLFHRFGTKGDAVSCKIIPRNQNVECMVYLYSSPVWHIFLGINNKVVLDRKEEIVSSKIR